MLEREKTREIAEGITLTATGVRPEQLNITISDCGEGQTPDKLPDTILSLNRSNKQNIAFVQGQFNQGGTGALRFCGQENPQLVISRRNPALLYEGARATANGASRSSGANIRPASPAAAGTRPTRIWPRSGRNENPGAAAYFPSP